MTNDPGVKKGHDHHRKAEKVLSKTPEHPDPAPLEDLGHLNQELSVHGIELEMQNEELRRSGEQLEESNREYADLYDFAPLGYLTFDEKGLITKVNLTATSLLGAEGSLLLGTPSTVAQDITEQTRAEKALKQRLERLEILSDTASRLLASPSPQEVVKGLCTRVMEHLDCHAFFNYLVDDGRNCMRLNAYAGIPEETAREIYFLDFGVVVCDCAARDATGIVAEDIPTTLYIHTELVRSFGIKAYACHPLLVQGRVIGTLSFGTKTRLTFTYEELSFMKAVAHQVATAMERMRLLTTAEEKGGKLEVRVEGRNEQLRLESAYNRSLIEASFDPLVTISPEGKISDLNTAMELVTGCSRQELIGTDFSDYFTEPRNARAGYQMIFDKGLVRDYPLRIRHRDGHVTPVLCNASAYRDDTGSVIGVFAAARDVTDLEQLEAQLRQAQKMEALATLVGRIAHDFNNILMAIIGFTELLLGRAAQGSRDERQLERIMAAGIRGQELVRKILIFSRRGEPEKEPSLLSGIVHDTVALLGSTTPDSDQHPDEHPE